MMFTYFARCNLGVESVQAQMHYENSKVFSFREASLTLSVSA